MAGSIKIPYARREGRLVHITSVASGLHRDCLCVACHQPLVARRPQGGRADHFAHHVAASCNAETALHLLAKEILENRIGEALAAKAELAMSWRCPACEADHGGNLLKRARRVVIEHDLGGRTPDLCLLDEAGRPCAALEIVVTHEPEPAARAFYRGRRIPVVEFRIADAAGLEHLAGEALRPSAVSYCPVPAWKHRIVILAGTVLKLGDVEITLEGDRLGFAARDGEGGGGYFAFDQPDLAARALERLKDGSLAGLYEPDWLVGAVAPEDVAEYRREFAMLGLRAYGWGMAGMRQATWHRGQGTPPSGYRRR